MATWKLGLRTEKHRKGLESGKILARMKEIAQDRHLSLGPTVFRYAPKYTWDNVAIFPPVAYRHRRDEWFEFTIYDINDCLSVHALRELLAGVCLTLAPIQFEYTLEPLAPTWRV